MSKILEEDLDAREFRDAVEFPGVMEELAYVLANRFQGQYRKKTTISTI